MKLFRQIGRASNQKRLIDPILPRKDTQDNIKTIIKRTFKLLWGRNIKKTENRKRENIGTRMTTSISSEALKIHGRTNTKKITKLSGVIRKIFLISLFA